MKFELFVKKIQMLCYKYEFLKMKFPFIECKQTILEYKIQSFILLIMYNTYQQVLYRLFDFTPVSWC